VTSKRIQNVVREWVNIVDKTKENQKSVKRVEVERDTSKGNEKKKRSLTKGYQSIVGNEFDVKKQPTQLYRSIMIGEFLYQKGEKVELVVEEENDHQDDEFQNEIEDEGLKEASFNEREENEIINEEESLNEREDNEITTEEGNIAFLQILLLIIYLCIQSLYIYLKNFIVTIATSKKRTRRPTQCLKIHSRKIEDRPEVILDEDGEPIGPNDKVLSNLSYFLRTIARNSNFCPLIYTNFKALVKDHKDRIWKYVMVFK